MPTYDLGLEHVSLAFATKNIFNDVTQGVFEGDRIGIVGKNGDGKSTLLHLFKGTQEPDSGRVTIRGGLTLGMLDQRDPLDDNATVREAALEGREDYEWAAETKSREIVEALLGGISLEAKIGSLSGGQRRRADLARLLLKDWDILALDEPTNHLDVVTIHWLAEHLKNRWPAGSGALLLVAVQRRQRLCQRGVVPVKLCPRRKKAVVEVRVCRVKAQHPAPVDAEFLHAGVNVQLHRTLLSSKPSPSGEGGAAAPDEGQPSGSRSFACHACVNFLVAGSNVPFVLTPV